MTPEALSEGRRLLDEAADDRPNLHLRLWLKTHAKALIADAEELARLRQEQNNVTVTAGQPQQKVYVARCNTCSKWFSLEHGQDTQSLWCPQCR